jgi:hypothetical protein
MRKLLLLALAGAFAAPILAQPSTDLASEVLAEINRTRMAPAAYVQNLRVYRGYFEGNHVRFPGDPVLLRTREGVVPVDEAIRQLAGMAASPPVQSSPALARAAAEHVADIGPRGGVSHDGTDGSTAGDRIRRRGGGGATAEIISFGGATGAAVLRQFVVDDGVPGRGHRTILLSGNYRYAGVACGPHRTYRVMCVVDFAATVSD